MKKVWLFSRLSEFTDNESVKRTMDICRNKALEKGYTIVDETMVVGSSDLAMAAVKDIIERNNIENKAECIFSINGNALSIDLKKAQEIYEYITENGMSFETSAGDIALLDKNEPLGAVFNLLATGQKQLPEDFPFEDQEDLLGDDEDIFNEPMVQSM